MSSNVSRSTLRTLSSSIRASPAVTSRRSISSTATRRSGGGDSHYDPPSGWLWGVPPGTKPEKEGWEGLWYWGFGGSIALGVIAYAFKPDSSIDTWALEEAKRRLQAEGTLPEEDSEV